MAKARPGSPARSLSRELTEDKINVNTIAPWPLLCTGEQRQVWLFGTKDGRSRSRPDGLFKPQQKERAMAKTLKAGDKVSWDSSGGHSVGKVVKKQTTPTQIKGHKVAASKDNPQYIVKSDKSGKTAAHKASELKKA